MQKSKTTNLLEDIIGENLCDLAAAAAKLLQSCPTLGTPCDPMD